MNRVATPLVSVVDERAARAVREALIAANWIPGSVAHVIGDDIAAALERGEPGPVTRAFDQADLCDKPFGVVARLFGLHLPIRTDLVADAIPLEDALALGLVETVGEYTRATLQVTPFDRPGWWVVSDWSAPVERGPLPDQSVLGYSGASRTLATLTPRDGVAVAADIGTGSGVQALLLTDHADHVIATDIDDRALAIALRTFTLSDVDVDLRKGSMFDPLHGQRVDLLVSNPPFVIGRHGSVFRDSGLEDDGLGRLLLQDVANHLTPQGLAVVLLNWLHRDGVEWQSHVSSWVESAQVRAWFAQRQLLDPAAYASAWLTDLGRDPRSHAGEHRQWLDALDATGATGVGMGWAVVTPDSVPRVVAEDVSTAVRLPSGDEVLESLDLIAATDLDAFAILQARLAPGTGVRIFRAAALGGPSSATPPIVGVAGGWRGDVVVDDVVAAFVEKADGTVATQVLIEAVASGFGLDVDEVLGAVLAPIVGLVRTGVLVVA